MGRLRAYGNAIVSEVAATFIKAVMEHLITGASKLGIAAFEAWWAERAAESKP